MINYELINMSGLGNNSFSSNRLMINSVINFDQILLLHGYSTT